MDINYSFIFPPSKREFANKSTNPKSFLQNEVRNLERKTLVYIIKIDQNKVPKAHKKFLILLSLLVRVFKKVIHTRLALMPSLFIDFIMLSKP